MPAPRRLALPGGAACDDGHIRAALLTGFGGPEHLQVREAQSPHPAHGEVLIAVSAAAVKPADINTRTGWYGSGGGAAR